ncbi:hypothetical protein, partial [Achromobacter xylosoxidans]|uniref:hypothetical protein n=1 Tax=Alcaligenes xylosoxydans xylosoxydans TaxID=85698 RepID=UPI001E3A4B0E
MVTSDGQLVEREAEQRVQHPDARSLAPSRRHPASSLLLHRFFVVDPTTRKSSMPQPLHPDGRPN